MIKSFRVIANILFVFGIILLAGSLVTLYKVHKFRSLASKAEGTVVSISRNQMMNNHGGHFRDPLPASDSDRDTPAFHHTVFSFVVTYIAADGTEQRYESGYSDMPPSYFPGDKVTVYYNKNDVQLGGWNGLIHSLLTAGAGLFLIIFRIIYYFIKRNE
jgi:hypothetical protein